MQSLRSPSLQRAALILLLLASLVIRGHAVLFEKQGLSYDESLTYLSSAGLQGVYNSTFGHERDTVVTASAISSMYDTPALNFKVVAVDLATLDGHPPLFFWALHVVHHFFGFHVNDGMILNLLVGLLTMLLLFHIVRRVSGSADLALLVVVLYTLSPTVAQLDLESRNYQFLGLLALASAWLSERIGAGQRDLRTYVLFTVVNALGFLTHYYYGLILVPGVLLQLRRHGLGRQWFIYMGSLVASLACFILIFPQFFIFYERFLHEVVFVQRPVLNRVWLLLYFGLASFFANGSRVIYVIIFLILATAAFHGLSRPVVRVRIKELLRGKGALSYFLWTLLWQIAFTTLFYFKGIAPPQAVGEQYFSYIWPLFAWFTVLGLRAGLPSLIRPWAIGVLLVAMLLSLRTGVRDSYYLTDALPAAWFQRMNAADRLVSNDMERSLLPRMSIHLRPDLPIHLTKKLRLSPEDEEAGNLCVFIKGEAPLNDPALRELMARPGTRYELLSYRDFSLVGFSPK